MKSKKTIAFVIPSLHPGGMERVMSELVNYFSNKKELEVHLVLYGKSREVFYDLSDNIIIHKPKFTFNEKYRIYNTFKTIIFIRSIIKSIAPVSVLSFGELWNNLVLFALIGLKYPILISDRCKPDKTFRFVQNTLRNLLYPRATGMIAQTEKAKRLYKKEQLNENIVVIGNPIREIIENNTISKENIVISVGRLINTKHFDRLIDIFARINHSDWKLIIVGGDAIKQKNSITLQDQINQLGLQDKVFLEGNQKDIEGYLLRSKIFAFTSSSEGFPNVIGEAMSAGLPVVAYDCIAGPSDMIEDGKNGYLIPLFDDVKFEEKLRYLMVNEDERVRMGAYARESIQKFSVDKIGEEYYKFLFDDK
jgi:GalNAc-alpha-(1->4)-GalNAc-alpha-(1->3)-diNAcBac-PP-undecaprenol alpha-1,4-N-acetyl-D-galactosaminyltransferase